MASGEDTHSLLGINDLPLELISSILLLVPLERRQPRQTPTEVHLSHVCTRWRAAALATPTLWTDIYVYSKKSAIAAAAYIRRSGTALPLNVRIDIYSVDKANGKSTRPGASKTLALIASLRTILSPIAPRLRSLLLFTFRKYTMNRLLNIFGGAAPRLQRFRAVCANTDSEIPIPQEQQAQAVAHTGPPSPPLFPGGMPSIQFLETDSIDSIDPSAISGGIKALHLNNISATSGLLTFSYFKSLFQATSQSLVSLSLQGGVDVATWPVDGTMPRFTFPRLRDLRLRDDGALMLKFLLSASAPLLESVWIETAVQPLAFLLTSPQFQDTAKFPQLRYMTIPSYNFNFVSTLAKVFPTVTHLHVPHANFNHHAKKLSEVLQQGWASVGTIVISLPREKQMETMLDTLRECRHVKNILLDPDTLRLVRLKHGSHIVVKRMQELKDYPDPWWQCAYSSPFDDI